MTKPAFSILPCALLLFTVACGAAEPRSTSGVNSDCPPYEPATAKRTFDGRVGSIIFRNDGRERVHVEVYHPDGHGSVELSWTVPPGHIVSLGAGFGNDWGIRAGTGCAATLGRTGHWNEGRFIVAWRDNALTAGTPPTTTPAELRPNEN